MKTEYLIILFIFIFVAGFISGMLYYQSNVGIDIGSICNSLQQAKELSILDHHNLTSLSYIVLE